MKRIGIDARLYFQTGVGVYIRNLLYFLEQIDTEGYEFYVYVMNTDSSHIKFKKNNFQKQEVDFKWHTISEQTGFLKQLNNDKLDLMHFTYFSHPILYTRPFIATIHDVILLQHKTGKASTLSSWQYSIKYRAFKLAFMHQIKQSNVIITPTDTVKKELLTLFGKKYEDKIKVVYEGIDVEKITKKESSSLKNKMSKPFFLYVGNFYPHKNVERLLDAFSSIEDDVQLVLVGPSDFFADRIKHYIKEKNLDERVIQYLNVSDEDLIYFYKHAMALVHPSLSEGFGLPLLEAAYFHLPVVASDIPIFKEIMDGHFSSFNPNNISDVSDALKKIIKHKPVVDYSSILQKYSFETMARTTFDIYTSQS